MGEASRGEDRTAPDIPDKRLVFHTLSLSRYGDTNQLIFYPPPKKTTEGTTSGSFTLLQSTLPSTHRQLLHSSSQRLLWGNWSPAWWQLFPTPTTAQTHRLTFWGLHPKPAPGWC